MLEGKKNVIIISLMSLSLASTLIATATYALYTDSIQVNHHVTSGAQELEFKKIHEEGKIIDSSSGLLKSYSNDTTVDLASNPNQIFNIDKFVPYAYIDYTFEIKNIGSTAFDYYFTFIFDEGEIAFTQEIDESIEGNYQNLAELFMSQLELIIYSETETIYSQTLLSYYQSDDKQIEMNSLLINEMDQVHIKLSFINDDDNILNNYVQNTKLTFDLNLEAIQKIE